MLYIFLVDTGSMLTLDVDLALKPVSGLCAVVESAFGIPQEKQVLLISGGESLEPEERVCKYNAGTDTNPIFLFSMSSIERSHPPDLPPGDHDSSSMHDDLLSRAEASMRLPDSQNSVSRRASLAQEFVAASQDQIAFCERVIHDQHLQHQGWLAVVANVEDTASDLIKKNSKLMAAFKEYLDQREDFREMVDMFDEDMAILHRIPVFPSLLAVESQESMVGSVILNPDDEEKRTKEISLLEWIKTRGSSQSLEQIADSCFRTIEGMDDQAAASMDLRAREAASLAHNDSKKEIRGVGERLQSLEKLLCEARKLTKEQGELAQAFAHNRERASGLRDAAASILPDLCASHREQLKVMAKNYQSVASIRRRCASSKLEMCALLHSRMKWVVGVQNRMAEAGQHIIMYAEELRRFKRKLEVIEQLHTAPSMYIATAVEVVRRRAFSERYLEKSADLSDKFTQLHREEFSARNVFQGKLRKHFLSKMFPGMEDVPPEFATRKPEVFDNKLPAIGLAEVERLRKEFPDLAKSLQIPDGAAIANLLSKSINQELTQEDDETRLFLKNMPRKINLNSGGEVNTISLITKVIGERKKHRPGQKASSTSRDRTGNESDTDSEDDSAPCSSSRASRNGRRKGDAKRKLTQSLPLDDSTLTLEPAAVLKEEVSGAALTKALASAAFKAENAASSSSAGDPATSSSANTGNNSSVVPSSSSDGSVMKQTAEAGSGGGSLAHLETNSSSSGAAQVASLNAKLAETEASLARLKASLRTSLSLLQMNFGDLRKALPALRARVTSEKSQLNHDLKVLADSLCEHVRKIHTVNDAEIVKCLEEKDETVRELTEKLELEAHKLADCHGEIDIYRQQLNDAVTEVDKLKADHAEDEEAWRTEMEEKCEEMAKSADEARKKMLLEHEVELDTLKESLSNKEVVRRLEDEIARLKKACEDHQDMIAALKKKTRLMENAQEEKFHTEKDKIVQILEAGFTEREKLAVNKCREEMEAVMEERERAVQERLERAHEREKGEIRTTLGEEEKTRIQEREEGWKMQLEDALRKKDDEAAARLQEARRLWEEEKAKAMKQREVELTIKAKKELDSLRSRFKVMQSASGMARSPTSSESELPTESPKSDLIESIRSTILAEHEAMLRQERTLHEERVRVLHTQHEEELERVRSEERNRETAEQQVKFNEGLKKAVDEREKAVKALEDKTRHFKEESQKSYEESRRLQEKIQKLQSELDDLKRGSSSSLNIYPSSPPPQPSSSSSSSSASQLQRENERLRARLTSSMHEHLRKSGSVSVDGAAEKGDRVMVVWSEEHNNFAVYSESPQAPLNFLHSDSLPGLGLVAGGGGKRRYMTAEVVEKEYCQAKKAENRFRVPQGTKFYRVKCKPIKDSS